MCKSCGTKSRRPTCCPYAKIRRAVLSGRMVGASTRPSCPMKAPASHGITQNGWLITKLPQQLVSADLVVGQPVRSYTAAGEGHESLIGNVADHCARPLGTCDH